MERDIEKLSRKILTDAILIVEDNDYLGLLIENAKTMIKNGGQSFNLQNPTMLVN